MYNFNTLSINRGVFMSTSISTRLVSLRKETGLSQKDAAAGLGVSQALLSHYEKGIRECGLDFLCRAAEFYKVSTDYLLGLSKTRLLSDALFIDTDIPNDAAISTSTIFRASAFLAERMGAEYSPQLEAINILTLYKIYCGFFRNDTVPPYLTSGLLEWCFDSLNEKSSIDRQKPGRTPLCVKTIINEAEALLKAHYVQPFNR